MAEKKVHFTARRSISYFGNNHNHEFEKVPDSLVEWKGLNIECNPRYTGRIHI